MRFLSGIMLCLGMLVSVQVLAQEVLYYDKSGKETDKANAFYLIVIETGANNTAVKKTFKTDGTKVDLYHYRDYQPGQKKAIKHGPYQEWFENGQLSEEGYFLDDEVHGKSTIWHENGQIAYVQNYRNGVLQDTLKGFYESGALRRFEVYEDGLLIDGAVYTEGGIEIIPFFQYQQLPYFPGGEGGMFQFLRDTIQYPRAAVRRNISGVVFVSFVVTKEGYIEDIVIEKSVHRLIDAETIRVIKAMPKWTPGSQEGKPVPVRYNMPVKFTLK